MTLEQVTHFDDRHLSGTATRSDDVEALLDGEYDYLLLGSSWDRRSIELACTRPSVGLAQLFLPHNVGTGSLRVQHDAILAEYVGSVAQEVDTITEGSEALVPVWTQIESAMRGLRKQLDRPLRVLIDLSAMPRYFTLGALAVGLNENVAAFVDVIYGEANYGPVVARSDVPGLEYSASWEAVAVPGLEGDWFPANRRHFLVSIGFEGTKVGRLVERWDPEAITVLFPHPSVRPEYEATVEGENALWMKQYGVEPDDIVRADPANAIASWQIASTSPRPDPTGENVYCLLAGSKPHGLGLSLYSLARERPAVMYVRPTIHEQRDISSNGVFWRFRLTDRSML